MIDTNLLIILSEIIGWIYFVLWSASFYFQLILNEDLHSVRGLSFDYTIYNLTGFTAYTIYTICGYYDETFGTGPVSLSDIAFSIHSLIITLLMTGQMIYYYEKRDSNQKISFTCKLFTYLVWSGFFILLLLEKNNIYQPYTNKDIITFNSLFYLGNCKVLSTLIKYLPQVYFNYERKSTAGWSIYNVLCDFFGSLFCLIQTILETFITNRTDSRNKINSVNIAKYGLGTISLIYDSIFIAQHFWLYRKENVFAEMLDEENRSGNGNGNNGNATSDINIKDFKGNAPDNNKNNNKNQSVQLANASFVSKDQDNKNSNSINVSVDRMI